MPRCIFFPLHLSCLVFSELPGLVLTLFWGNSVFFFKHIFCSFLSFPSGIPIMHITALTYSVPFHCLFSLYFFILEASIEISSNSEVLFSAMFSLLISPLWTVFISHIAFLFDSFLDFPPLCLHCPLFLAFYLLKPLVY